MDAYSPTELKQLDTGELVEHFEPALTELQTRVPAERRDVADQIETAWSEFKNAIVGAGR